MNKHSLSLPLFLSGFWSDKEVTATWERQKLLPGLSNNEDECQAHVCLCDMCTCEHMLEHMP